MTQPPDPEHINFFLEHLGKILGSIASVLLAWMAYLSHSKKATMAKAVLTETPVSHAELLRCQMEVNTTVRDEFRLLRKELMNEITNLRDEQKEDVTALHIRINSIRG